MIKQIKLKAGRSHGSTPTTISVSPVTVFVGPNNSGKTRVLDEIYQCCINGKSSSNDILIDDIAFDGMTQVEAEQTIEAIRASPSPHHAVAQDHVLMKDPMGTYSQVPKARFIEILTEPGNYPGDMCALYLRRKTLRLDGASRINLTAAQPAGDLLLPPVTSFQVLFRENPKRAELQRIVYDAFGVHLLVDPTNLGQLRLRLSAKPPKHPSTERSVDDDALAFHTAALSIDQFSDGVKAFVGIMSAIIAGDPLVVLVDEPEAFLHPPLAFKLGYEMCRIAKQSGKRIFVSTHSPQFVMGCIQSNTPINIVRLTYQQSKATARILPGETVTRLMRHPLLRSAGVLSGLFYEVMVVTEGDTDRAFYQEVNERLLRDGRGLGIRNCLFVNAQNKQTIHHVMKPLRELGIPVAAIVDVDIIKDGGGNWTDLLRGAFAPEAVHQPLAILRGTVKDAFELTNVDMKRGGGTDLLAPAERAGAEHLFDQLAEFGIFVVRRGEVESWLSSVGAAGHGPRWLVDMFERMGEDPEASNYVRPSKDDVWKFMDDIREWLLDPSRKGIPS